MRLTTNWICSVSDLHKVPKTGFIITLIDSLTKVIDDNRQYYLWWIKAYQNMTDGGTNKNNTIVYWASQEQYSMQDLLKFVTEAEKGGFNSCLTSDHFHPWWHDNGYGNFTWVWMAAAAERTKSMRFISGVTAAVYRYNAAIIAQAFASLDVLYPGRIGLGIGTGEA
jgi:Luciferase-like monooxygenase